MTGNTLVWRRRAEEELRARGLDYTIIRTGILLNAPANRRAIRVTQEDLPLSVRYRIARADVADAFVAALDHPRLSRATLEIVQDRGTRQHSWHFLLDGIRPDHAPAETVPSAPVELPESFAG